MKDLYPVTEGINDDTTFIRQRESLRTILYNDFFNASDKVFADANPNWELTADAITSRFILGYTWGYFFPGDTFPRLMQGLATLGIRVNRSNKI